MPNGPHPDNQSKMENETPQFPNRLREVREARLLSRAGVIQLCRRLSDEDDARFARVSMTTLHDLECGLHRPRLRTAATLSKVLEEPVDQLFPSGLDSTARNPGGNTSDASTWIRRGRPKKNSTSSPS